jgi:hypothetical protein
MDRPVVARRADWWSRRDSNPRPPRCERGALPAELLPHGAGGGHSTCEAQARQGRCHQPAGIATVWRRPPESGGACHDPAALATKRRRAPRSGSVFLSPESLATNWRRNRETGNACHFPESNATDWQPLPVSRIQCHGLATVASFPNPTPQIGKRCQFPDFAATLWRRPPPDRDDALRGLTEELKNALARNGLDVPATTIERQLQALAKAGLVERSTYARLTAKGYLAAAEVARCR